MILKENVQGLCKKKHKGSHRIGLKMVGGRGDVGKVSGNKTFTRCEQKGLLKFLPNFLFHVDGVEK